MKKYILISIVASSFITTIQADEVESAYKRLSSISLFTSNNEILSSGRYNFIGAGGESGDLHNSNFVGSYTFGDEGEPFRLFIMGGFGFSKAEQDRIYLYRSSGSIDSAELKSLYYKLGGGFEYNPTDTVRLKAGVSSLWMETDGGHYGADIPLNMADAKDREIQKIFNEDSSNRLDDLFATINYHPIIWGYHSYLIGDIHYLDFNYDNSIESVNGYSGDLKVGFHTHTLAKLYNYPVWAEFFLSSTLLDSDLKDLVGFSSAFTEGTSLHWKVGPKFKGLFNGILKDLDINLNLQATQGSDDFDGWKASVGVGIVRF